jgi:hypothetical protein
MTNDLVRTIPVWVILILLTAANAGFSWNIVLSCALTIAVLILVIHATSALSWSLVWMVFPLYFGITWINTLDEALLFHVLPPATAFPALANGATIAFTTTILLALSMDRMVFADRAFSSRQFSSDSKAWLWALPVGAFLYFIIYLIAGICVRPFIMSFYSGKPLPSLKELFAIQFFRGLLYIALALPFARRMAGHRLHAGVVLGLCYSILGGIAPLLPPNAFMPVAIRIAHSMEVGISNFIFGLLVACLLVPRTPKKAGSDLRSKTR